MRRMLGNAFQSSGSSSSSPQPKQQQPTSSESYVHSSLQQSSTTLARLKTAAAATTTTNSLATYDPLSEDLFSPDRLPFRNSRASSAAKKPIGTSSKPIRSNGGVSSSNHHSLNHDPPLAQRSTSDPGSEFLTLKSLSNDSNNMKFDMMVQLLCSQALVEASSFQMLPYDRVERLKKEQLKLESRLETLGRKIHLEIKIRDATNMIIDTDPVDGGLDQFSGLNRSESKLKELYAEKETTQLKLFNVRTRLLQHISAVLCAGLKKMEQQASSFPFDSSTRSPTNTLTNQPRGYQQYPLNTRSPSPALTAVSSRSTVVTLDKFDGPHLFANSQDGLDFQPFSGLAINGTKSNLTSNFDTGQLESLQNQVLSLNELVQSKESALAEQSTELSLLQLEVDTLQRSLADSAANRQQQESRLQNDQSMRELEMENNQLKQAAEAMRREEQVIRRALESSRADADILRADLERQRTSGNNSQTTMATRAREAEDRARGSETARSELNLELEEVKAELKVLQVAAQTHSSEISKLTTTLRDSEKQKAGLDTELVALRSQVTRNNQAHELATQSQQDWQLLITSLSKLYQKLTSQEQMLPLGLFLSSSGIIGPSSVDRKKFIDQLVQTLGDYLDHIHRQSDDHLTEVANLTEQFNTERVDLKNEKVRLETQVEALEAQIAQALQAQKTDSVETDEVEKMNEEIISLRKKLEESEATTKEFIMTDKTLKDLYKNLTGNVEARTKVDLDSDLTTFRQAYEAPKKPSGLGGLFGLGKRAPTPTIEETEYSLESLVDRVKLLLDNDRKLVDRLIKYEVEKDQHKTNSLRAQKLVSESQEALKVYQSQVKELEERLEYSDTQSAAMLEKFNDLMENEERANMIARRAEANIIPLQNQVKQLTEELEKLKVANEKLSRELEEVKEVDGGAKKELERLKKELTSSKNDIEDLLDEIEKLKEREIKNRNQFINELTEAQNETSGLRTKVRQLERADRNR